MEYTIKMKPDFAKKAGLLPRLENLSLLRRLTGVYAALLEQPLTPRQTLHLLHAQLAGMTLLLTACASLLFYVLELAWFGMAMNGCARALHNGSQNLS